MFLGSGSVIHAMGGEQDIRKMGGLHKHMKITSFTFLIGCLAIADGPLAGGSRLPVFVWCCWLAFGGRHMQRRHAKHSTGRVCKLLLAAVRFVF
jgi:NADH:ubiquinone oxidoreductase subunit 5 (subunit L)/multisubunit Na+/H+ antiporter MnhA subunit